MLESDLAFHFFLSVMLGRGGGGGEEEEEEGGSRGMGKISLPYHHCSVNIYRQNYIYLLWDSLAFLRGGKSC